VFENMVKPDNVEPAIPKVYLLKSPFPMRTSQFVGIAGKLYVHSGDLPSSLAGIFQKGTIAAPDVQNLSPAIHDLLKAVDLFLILIFGLGRKSARVSARQIVIGIHVIREILEAQTRTYKLKVTRPASAKGEPLIVLGERFGGCTAKRTNYIFGRF